MDDRISRLNGEEEFLEKYNPDIYEKPSVTNDIILFTTDDKVEENKRKVPKKGMQILLIKRDEYPEKGKFAIPGGFVRFEEGLEDGARRKLKEETGIENLYIEQLYTFGDINRDKRTRVISVANIALSSKDKIDYVKISSKKESSWFWVNKELISSEVTESKIKKEYILSLTSESENKNIKFKIEEIISKNIFRDKVINYTFMKESNSELAFDHCKIINTAIDRIRNKIQYTPIALNLLPKLFTVREAQSVYEAIMGRELLNFRRKMGDMIVETSEKIEGRPFRPAKMFKFNEEWENEF